MTKILLVEDDKNLREIYGVRLLAEGYDIVSAGDGEEALAMAIKERPTLILSDVMMPKISGFDMLDILRSTTETKDIKVIIMTALSSEEQRARGESLGADRYLVKSQVGIEDVIRAVHEVLQDGITPFLGNNPSPNASTPTPTPAPTPAPVMPNAPPVTPPAPAPVPAPAPAPAPVVSQSLGIPPTPSSPSVNPMPTQTPSIKPTPVPPPAPTPTPTIPPRPIAPGERVIHPLPQQNPKVDMGQLMSQELNKHNDNSGLPPTPPVPPLM